MTIKIIWPYFHALDVTYLIEEIGSALTSRKNYFNNSCDFIGLCIIFRVLVEIKYFETYKIALNPINLVFNMEYTILNKGPSINYITHFIRIYNQVLLLITFPVLFSFKEIFLQKWYYNKPGRRFLFNLFSKRYIFQLYYQERVL